MVNHTGDSHTHLNLPESNSHWSDVLLDVRYRLLTDGPPFFLTRSTVSWLVHPQLIRLRVTVKAPWTVIVSSHLLPLCYERLSLWTFFLFSEEGCGSMTVFLPMLIDEVSSWKAWVWLLRPGGRWLLCSLTKTSLKLGHLREVQGMEVDSAVILGMFCSSETAHRWNHSW